MRSRSGLLACVYFAVSVQALSKSRLCAVVKGKLIPCGERGFQLSTSSDDLIAFSGAVSAIVAAFPGVSRALEKLMLNLPTTKYNFEIPENYISRPALESKIQKVYDTRKKSDAYSVLVGVKGSGKSSAVAHVLSNKPGVLYLRVSQADTSSSLLRKLLSKSGERCEENDIDLLDVDILYPVFNQAAKDMGGRRVTIVLEIESGTQSDSVLYMTKSMATSLAVVSNVIIILSEANAGLAFGDDLRQKFIWVDGMTEDEATSYAKKEFPAISESDLKKFIEKVGTIPLHVREFTNSLENGESAADYIEEALCAAKRDLSAFAHKPSLEALKLSPDGVRTDRFSDIENEGVNLAEPKQVALAMKERQAIIYHHPSREYRMASRAHRMALLERWSPTRKSPSL